MDTINQLPRVYQSGYVQARKRPGGKYQLFFTGTLNEVFPGELFNSPQEARNYYQAQIIKANSK